MSKFKVGDIVVCVDTDFACGLSDQKEYEVIDLDEFYDGDGIVIINDKNMKCSYFNYRFKSKETTLKTMYAVIRIDGEKVCYKDYENLFTKEEAEKYVKEYSVRYKDYEYALAKVEWEEPKKELVEFDGKKYDKSEFEKVQAKFFEKLKEIES